VLLFREFKLSEESIGRKRAGLLARIMVVIIVLVVNFACIMAVLSLVEAGTATPEIYVADLTSINSGNLSSAYVFIGGKVINPSSLAATNVSVLVDVYDQFVVPPVGSTNIDLGTVSGDSSKSFSTNVSYSSSYYYDFEENKYGVDYGLLLGSRFDFGLGFFAIALPIAALLPVLDVYCAYRLGLFGWIKARKKVVATTIAWAVAIALVVIIPFALFYMSNPGITISNYLDEFPQLYFWDWILIFLVSILAGAIIANIETVVYSSVASLILSVILEFLYGSFFVWYGLGYSRSFSMTMPGLTFLPYLQTVLQDVFLIFLRMINIAVPCFCVLGVFIGAVVRSYFEPSVD
jgi:hypothetical protein